jgi:glycosyltransferase involved in cell wall biosynthesis
MNIGVNALYLIPGGVGGTEIYLRNLLAAMAEVDTTNEYFVFTNRETRDLTPAAANFHPEPQSVAARVRPARLLWEQTALPVASARLHLDVLFNPGFTAPAVAPCPCVTVFHDLQHKRHPEYFRWFDLPFWNLLLWASARSSAALISVSEATRADLRRYYGTDSAVVHHGVAADLFEIACRRQPDRFLLCVSTLHPHKNIDGLVRAFGEFRQRHSEFRLVVAGMRGFHAKEIERAISESNVAGSVEITGWLSRDALRDLYGRAWAVICPSRFEGFGMPALEAMAAAVPLACSDIAPFREVAGDAALFFPADDIGPALERICFDQEARARLVETGRERARKFTWHQAAEQTIAVLRSVKCGAANPGRRRLF